MSEDLSALSEFAGGLLARMDAAGRRKLAREIAHRLRETNIKRIAAQQNPDGSAYEPRKNTRLRRKKGAIRRAMFSKLRTARWLKVEAGPDAAVVAFAGQVQRIAQVHHHGLRDRVDKRGGPEITYPARRLLGITDTDFADVENLIIAHLSGA